MEQFLEPEKIIAQLDVKQGDHAADFGAGHGFFTIPLARAVGGDGRVFAVDVQKDILEVIKAKAAEEHLLNVEPIWGDLERPGGSKIKDRFADLVLISNILFQAEDKHALLKEAYRVLRDGGRLAVIEWGESKNQTGPPVGPPASLRVTKETAQHLAFEAGFDTAHEFNAGAHHYGLLFKK